MLKKFTATIDVAYTMDITKRMRLGDVMPLRYSEEYRDKMRELIKEVTAKNDKNVLEGKDPIQINVTFDLIYAKRSLDQNSWLWSAHAIEARLINTKDQSWRDSKGITWYKPGSVTPEEVHQSYLELYSPRGWIDVQPGMVDSVRQMVNDSMGKVVKETYDKDRNVTTFEIWKTSRFLNVAEFCDLSEKVKQNLLAYGIDLDNLADYKTLLADLETVKADLMKDEPKKTEVKADPVEIVKDTFGGKVVEELELF